MTLDDPVKMITTKIFKYVVVMSILQCQVPADVMVKLYYSLVCSHVTYALLAWGSSGRTNAAKIEHAHKRARKLLTDYNHKILMHFSLNFWLLSFIKGFQHKYS